MLYRRLVSFWMEKHLGDDGNRLFFSYEQFVDDEMGADEAVRLATFLEGGLETRAMEWVTSNMERNGGKVVLDDGRQLGNGELTREETIDIAMKEAMQTMAPLEDVPCIWKNVVYSTISYSLDSGRNRRRSLQQEESKKFGFDCGDWIPSERPFTPENLMSMSQMLLELMNRWSRHQRLLAMLSGYHRDVNRAYLESTGKLDAALEERENLDKVQSSPSVVNAEESNSNIDPQQQQSSPIEPQPAKAPFHIIQASAPHTRSTVTTNWLVGLFEPEKDVAFMSDNYPELPIRQSGHDAAIDSTIVTKTHNLDLLSMYKLIRREWTLFSCYAIVQSFYLDNEHLLTHSLLFLYSRP